MNTDLVVTTTIQASPQEVFPYLVQPELLVRWLASWVDVDPRPGGVFAADVGDPVRGSYVAVDPPHRVVFTWGILGSQQLPAGSSTVEIELRPDGDATVVELTHRDLPVDRRADHQQGWTKLLDALASILQE
ncbi:MAG: SRPBCC domain-containing protein [Candidatus Dormibacteraeota bacterium]|uniref:SRPBCC domain-containing protein n=1 Tax=Candidatus Amunia macphersoniae TaxID=3127014 RepID=A0A934KCY7_9BACT|nr:SRPBCC domain-containing protein [Candidatus Dormibacteraeota bacterium]